LPQTITGPVGQLSSGLLTQVHRFNRRIGETCAMQDARYFRDQAALSLEIAGHMSDPRAAEKLRSDAARFFAKAVEAEKEAEGSVRPPADTDAKLR
jgi:hypothetical protein